MKTLPWYTAGPKGYERHELSVWDGTFRMTVQRTGPGLTTRPPRWFWVCGGTRYSSVVSFDTPEEAKDAAVAWLRTTLTGALQEIT